MRRNLLLILALMLLPELKAQERRIINIPDLPGYKTLICDFHMHTVFSDGLVWPTVRVDEAWLQGLDAIAISDHLEYLPHKKDLIADHNRAWQIAREYATGKDMIVIAATEITKGMPPGHLNALFIKDANPILNDDFMLAIKEAADQGAFIMWNHPGWKAQQPDTMMWWDEHTKLYDNGWLHGIEVVNYGEFYPMAVRWALEKDLCMISSSDMHDPFRSMEFSSEDHRVCTLVFATEKSEGGIREALFNGRTLAYTDTRIIGKKNLLASLFRASVHIELMDADKGVYKLINSTDLLFDINIRSEIFADWNKALQLKPGYEALFVLPPDISFEELAVDVSNLICDYEEYLSLPMKNIETVN